MSRISSDLIRYVLDERSAEAVIRVTTFDMYESITDGFAELYIIVIEKLCKQVEVKNFVINSKDVQVRWIDKQYFNHIMENRFHRRLIQWVLQGEIISDHNGYIQAIKSKFYTYPSVLQQRTICIEFTHFLRRYLEAKEYLNTGHLLDSYNSMLRALHHWARLTIIKAGEVPETIVWQQVLKIDYAVYKLYEELITASDSLEKRVELLLLACEFSVISEMAQSSEFLFSIMQKRQGAWSVDELLHHPDFQGVKFNLILLLEKLVERSLIEAIQVRTEYGIEKMYMCEPT
ncbi:nucleotidyltransferase-like protein [Aneurinibacillus tyrosinisolvens]|uniref:nucleotidyltransferase-like protein n=1 Tax=Aneurinibacillus tyrosinisolvens TaxID=1443435 RepID=UPI00063FBBE6|nr:nucleotidyltransferase-like protein [Aneurinibacillus tyrosinisolvens]